MDGWPHELNGHEFEQTQGVDEGQGSLECCNPWVAEQDMTQKLKNKMNTQGFVVVFYVGQCLTELPAILTIVFPF